MTGFLPALSLTLIVAYAALSWHFIGHWKGHAWFARNPRAEHTLLGVLLLMHAVAVFGPMLQGQLVALGVGHALAAVVWLMVTIYWTCGFFYRVEGLQLFMMPLACLTLIFALLFPGSHAVHDLFNPAFALHILVSMLAYSLFAIGAMLAILMLWLERALHARRNARLLSQLPPLLSLERMMFQVLSVGFVLLTATLISGVVFSEEVLGRPAAFTHKTVFGVISWLLFGGLLLGRQRYGWRGRVAIRWTLAGFVALLLAYIGSKIVLELILHRG
ncbi:MAG: cytochrome c biogenesis protein CcsA [Paludibacterium sp.]|uniref:cytochrome C assembly family protein n=1 Tax=Paludibacterium sp. TaxID=1917523 RepID=UPI00260010D5|nr:cytochrome c biogenesis protein CcsA [Paludibacterium sp.]MBV8048453.1 cytochrome c biogenesis protein CcsA [Paludibacterium sp.]MBV8647384.1 cytochrome c biogenesis protein CcsA [Paludibacterium sp.]